MTRRPTSISIIGWLAAVSGLVSAIWLPVAFSMPAAQSIAQNNPVPLPLQLAIGIAGALVTAVCGVAFLKGKDWGRTLYVGWTLASIVYALLTSPAKLAIVPSVMFSALVIFFLYRRPATAFFRGEA